VVELITINKCKKGDQRAFGRLYNETMPYLYSIVRRYIFDANSHKDLLQESYAQIFSKIDKFDPLRGEFKSFIRTVTVNICLMHLRKMKRLPILSSVEDRQEEGFTDAKIKEIENLNREDIDEILNDMPSGYKTVFLLHVVDDFDYEEIAEMLDITRETVRSQYFRAKKWILNKSVLDKKSASYGLF